MKMKAAIYYGPGDIRVEEIERPKVSDGFQGMGMIVKIKACGICNVMDLPRYQRTVLGVGTGIAHGHEWSGEVVEIGPKVTDVKVGDRVWGRSFLPCGKCAECLAKDYVKCKNFIQGMTGRWLHGAFAEYMLFPYVKEDPSILVKLAKDVTYRDAALIEPMRLCLGLAAKAKAGDVVVIIGQQFMGLAILARLKAMGNIRVIVSDVSKKRLEKSRELGADVVVDELKEDLVKVVMKETPVKGASVVMESAEELAGTGANVVIDTAGKPINFQQAVKMVGRNGTIWLTQPYEASFMVNPRLLGGASINNPWGTLGNGEMHVRSMEFIQTGRITAEKVVTHVFPLDKIKEAFEVALHSPDAIKVVIEP